MSEDFDEDTLETNRYESIEPIRTMRGQKLRAEKLLAYMNILKPKSPNNKRFIYENNIFIIPRKLYENSKTENIEALLTKFNEIIIDDTNKPYFIKPIRTKKETLIVVAKKFNRTNLDKGLALIHKSTDMISDLTSQIGTPPNRKKRYRF